MFGVFPKDDYQQTLRIKRFLMAFASYLLWLLIAIFAFLLELTAVPLNVLVICFFGIVLSNFSVYGIIKTGLNKRFKDPSLTLLQMVMATFWTMVFVYYAGAERSLVLLLYLIVFVFGLFRLKVREFLFLSLFAVIAYAAVILLHYLLDPGSMNTKTELLNLIVLAMVLPWFSLVGGYITNLRTRIAQSLTTSRVAEVKFRTIFDSASDGILLVKISDKRFYSANQKMCELTGYTQEEILQLGISDLHDQTMTDFVNEQFQLVLKERNVSLNNVALMKKDKSVLFADIGASVIDLEGEEYLLGIIKDITDRKKIEGKLRFEEQRFRALVEHSSDIIVLVNREGIITYINPAVEHILGFKPEERVGRKGLELIHPDDVKFIAESFITLISDPNALPIRGIVRLRQRDGSYCFIEGVGSNLVKNGIAEGVILNYRDITERKKAEEQLHLSEQRYRTILEDIQEGYFEVDLNGNFTFFNDTVSRVLGYSRDELMGMNNRQYTDKDELKKIYPAYHQVYTTEEAIKELVWKIRTKGGSVKYIEGSISLLKDFSGKPIGFRGTARDITERKKTEEEVFTLASIVRSSSEMVNLATLDEKMIFLNDAGGKMLGIDPNQIGDYTIMDFLPEPYVSKVRDEIIPALLSGNNWEGDLQYRNIKTGALTDIHALTFTIRYTATGAPIYLANVSLDITERKMAEQKLQLTLESLKKAVGTTIQVLVSALESRDPYTAGHQSRVAHLACAIAEEMGLSGDQIEGLRMAGAIHDIGKLSVPAEILTKPSKLTKLEFSLIKQHSSSGFEMLKDVASPWPLAEIVHQHHERMNGSGYPRNLKGDEILIEARILAVADVVESMASDRPYRASLGVEAALDEIESNKGILYDTSVVEACLNLFLVKGYQLP
ncbi:MAG: PAS domain S-box protein [Smithella sp.]